MALQIRSLDYVLPGGGGSRRTKDPQDLECFGKSTNSNRCFERAARVISHKHRFFGFLLFPARFLYPYGTNWTISANRTAKPEISYNSVLRKCVVLLCYERLSWHELCCSKFVVCWFNFCSDFHCLSCMHTAPNKCYLALLSHLVWCLISYIQRNRFALWWREL